MKHFIPYLLLLLLLEACNNKSSKKEDNKPVYSKEQLDTVRPPFIPIVGKPDLFEKAFIKGSQAMSNGVPFDLFGFNIGKIKITSGKIISCDPWLMEEYANLTKTVFPLVAFQYNYHLPD